MGGLLWVPRLVGVLGALREEMVTMKIEQCSRFFRSVLSCGIAMAAVAAMGQSLTAQTYTFTEWATPTAGSQPLHVISPSATQFYFTESAKDRLGGINTTTNAVTEWHLPTGSMPHGLVLDASGNVGFCAYGGDYIGLLNTTTSQVTMYPVPTAAGGDIHLDTTVSGAGTPIYFYSEAPGNKIAMLDPTAAMQVTEWVVPTAAASPRGVSIGPADGVGFQVYFAELSAHKIGMIDTTTNVITEWAIPKTRQVEHIHFVTSESGAGLVFFGDLANSYVGVLNVGTPPSQIGNTETLWTAPTVTAAVPDVYVVPGADPLVYFTERNGSKIGILDTQVAQGTTVSLRPNQITVTTVIPASSTVTPSKPTTLSAKTTTVTPTVTTPVMGIVTGGFPGFTEFTIPTSASGALGINGLGSPTIVFAEYTANKIGTLTSQ